MKKSIGGIVMLNVVIIFLVLVFAFIAGTFSYYKAYKVNRQIQNSIERYEGYNGGAQDEINKWLSSIGYTRGNSDDCPKTRDDHGDIGYLIARSSTVSGSNMYIALENSRNTLGNEEFNYCIYAYKDTDRTVGVNNLDTNYYYSYGIVTYIAIEVPIINRVINIPVFTRTEKIYKFTTPDSF